MSGKREVVNKGVNSKGNEYTTYSDGAYKYKNKRDDGTKDSEYFRPSDDHAFFEKKPGPEGPGCKWHENNRQGFRKYQE